MESGLVITCPYVVHGANQVSFDGALDPQELRCALLFWDRLALPVNNIIHISGGADADYLESAGLLSRPRIAVQVPVGGKEGMPLNELVPWSHIKGYEALNQKDPGVWALAQGDANLFPRYTRVEPNRGLVVELYNAIPVPNKDVPLADILEFKGKRASELQRLRFAIDEMYLQLLRSPDQDIELRQRVKQIDVACTDVLRTSKERWSKVAVSNCQLSFELEPIKLMGFVSAGLMLGEGLPLPGLAALLGGVASLFKLSSGIGIGDLAPARQTAYRYVYSFHKELF